VKEHEQYKQGYIDAFDWVRRTRIDIQQCSDPHGEKEQTIEKERKMTEIAATMNDGKIWGGNVTYNHWRSLSI
jgi:nesprin-1